MPSIRTDFWMKPIPLRQFDWSAWYDDDEPNDNGTMAVCYGRTQQEAIADLFIAKPPACVDCDGKGGVVPGITCATCEGSGERPEGDSLDPVVIVNAQQVP